MAPTRMIHAALPVVDPLIEVATPPAPAGRERRGRESSLRNHRIAKAAPHRIRGLTRESLPVVAAALFTLPAILGLPWTGRVAGPLALRSPVLRSLRPFALGSAVLLRWSRCRLLGCCCCCVLLLLLWRLGRAWLRLFLAWSGRFALWRPSGSTLCLLPLALVVLPDLGVARLVLVLLAMQYGLLLDGRILVPGILPLVCRQRGALRNGAMVPLVPAASTLASTHCPSARPSAAADPPATRGSTEEVPGSSAPAHAAGRPERLAGRQVPMARCTRSSHTSCRTGRPSTCRRRRSSSNSSVARSRPGSRAPQPVAGTRAG